MFEDEEEASLPPDSQATFEEDPGSNNQINKRNGTASSSARQESNDAEADKGRPPPRRSGTMSQHSAPVPLLQSPPLNSQQQHSEPAAPALQVKLLVADIFDMALEECKETEQEEARTAAGARELR